MSDVKEICPAMKRANEMFNTDFCDLPPLAIEFDKHMRSIYGTCSEMFVTTWSAYAQCAEGLECRDDMYIATYEHRKWFAEHKPAVVNKMPPGVRAYSDCQNHVIVNLGGTTEHGMDLICAVRLLRDLRVAVDNAAGFDLVKEQL